MMPTIKKISLYLFSLLGITSFAWATTPSTTIIPPTPIIPAINSNPNPAWHAANPQSKAIEFARQAGSIAGVAQACGQNVADFTQRITEAVNKLTTNPTDKAAAMLIYQRIAREAQMSEQKMQSIPCTKVLQDYRNLPIMQADYQEKVIAQLNPSEP
jgi:hypothetical protein